MWHQISLIDKEYVNSVLQIAFAQGRCTWYTLLIIALLINLQLKEHFLSN